MQTVDNLIGASHNLNAITTSLLTHFKNTSTESISGPNGETLNGIRGVATRLHEILIKKSNDNAITEKEKVSLLIQVNY